VILVATAGGTFGSRLVRMLAAADVPVRALAHHRTRGGEFNGLAVDVVVADLDDPASVAAAWRDVEQVVLATPTHPAMARRETSLLQQAERAVVDRAIKINGAVRLGGHPLAGAHAEAIQALKSSPLRWTLLSPALTMETALLPQLESARNTGVLWGSAGDGRAALIAAADVARAATVVLADRDHDGRAEYELTGPEALSFPEIAERLGAALGTPVHYRDVTEARLAGQLLHAGLSAERVEFEAMLYFAAIREGLGGTVSGDVERITGAPAASVEQFLTAFVHA
jgi:uncharacterized protein YbjT (DUF2867 family)